MYEIKITVDSEREVSTILEAFGLPDTTLQELPVNIAMGFSRVVEISQTRNNDRSLSSLSMGQRQIAQAKARGEWRGNDW